MCHQPLFVNALMKYAVLLTATNCSEMSWRDFIQRSYDYWVPVAEESEA